MTGLSIWWATPARAEAHFSAEELARSDSHHRPLRQAGLAAAGSKLVLLVVAAGILALVADDLDSAGIVAAGKGSGWSEAMTSGRVAIGAAAVVLALRLPATVADAWFEYAFRRGSDAHRPVPVRSFLLTVTVLALGSWLLMTAVAGVGYRLMAATSSWPLVLAVVVVVVIGAAVLVEQPLRSRWTGREQPVDPAGPVGVELAELATRFSLDDLRFLSRDADHAAAISDRLDGAVPNACALGVGGHRRVVVSEALLAEDPATRGFVVAHELVHVARHHVLMRGALTGSALILAIVVVAGLASSDRPWSWFALDPADPLGLPILVMILVVVAAALGLPLSLVSRFQERSADAGAAAMVGPLPASTAKGLYLATSVDLDPPLWSRVYGQHPTPAERLEYLIRLRRIGGRVGADAGSSRSETG